MQTLHHICTIPAICSRREKVEAIGGKAQGVHGAGVCSRKLRCSARVRPEFGRVAVAQDVEGGVGEGDTVISSTPRHVFRQKGSFERTTRYVQVIWSSPPWCTDGRILKANLGIKRSRSQTLRFCAKKI